MVSPKATTRRSSSKKCSNCPKELDAHSRQGRCSACYRFWLRSGKIKERNLKNARQPITATKCVVCGSPKLFAKNRCSACRKYQLDHNGVDRPERLWNPDALCENPSCDEPLPKVLRRYKSLCKDCDLFRSLTGELRPAKYIGKRFCDCGQVAIGLFTLNVGMAPRERNYTATSEVTYWLCQCCYDMEYRFKPAEDEIGPHQRYNSYEGND